MSILIRGMEMPKSCWDCEVGGAKQRHATCPFYSMEYWEQENYQDKIADGCPLIEIPPHGRLIDADALAKIVLNWITTQEKAYPNEDSNALSWRLGARAMGHQIYRDIEAAPTIIEAEGE